MSNLRQVGDASNYYGGVNITKHDGICFWGIENYDGVELEEIPEYLYEALLKFSLEKEGCGSEST